MKKSNLIYKSIFSLWLVLLVIYSGVSTADSISTNNSLELVNSDLFILKDDSHLFAAEEVFAKFKQGELPKNTQSQVSFGFTDSVVWALLPITNDTNTPKSLILKIDNAWLDEIDVFFYEQNVLVRNTKLGDTTSFKSRERQKRMPSVTYTFLPGSHYVLLRLRSEDPMTFPVYLGDALSVSKYEQKNDYFYGALYGGLIILLIYNLALYAYSKEIRYSLYSFYLFSFTAFNFTYTGHGFWLLWPTDISMQQWLMPVLMFAYLVSGVLFTIEYLQAEKYLPKLYSYRRFVYGALALLGISILLIGSRSFAVMVQLILLTTMSVWMLILGYYSYKNGNSLAKFFVPAVLMGAFGATISSVTTWGIYPYTQWAFRGIEIGMLLEMSLLSISFGFNFKVASDAKANAEHYARIDPLTSLYNRRALKELVYPIWNLGDRQKSSASVMLIDLDWFKRINDEYGHVVGDDVLKQVAEALKHRLRLSDIILRWGGEEFLVFLPDTDLLQANTLAEQLRRYFDEEKVNDIARVTVSVGVASGTAQDISFDELVKLADQSLYQAKKNGRNQVVSLDELVTHEL
ncbi:sensor domain-containing diguanylate cyclase [Psychrosphaera sp.]|nr:sensor domain-containing diguanylate cyclase [Psychrosphaera sp.]